MADRTLKASGKAEATAASANKLEVTATDGLVEVNVTDARGNILYVYHPLSGWYTQLDLRRDENDDLGIRS